jgi:UDP-N-acetylmuramoyl-L-alanyl-D-glutamate--2,6-diaminopimelate ligase
VSTLRPLTDGSTLASCAQVAGGRVVGDRSTLVRGVTLDSRAVGAGDLYAALPGANVHGASFAAAAVESGAVALLTDEEGERRARESGVSVPIVVVAQPREVLGAVSALVYGTTDPSIRLIGVTGTNGKTTTAYLLSSALEAMGRTLGLIGTVETRIAADRVVSARTTPEACDLHRLLAVMAERAVDDCVMEVSSHALVLHRVDGVRYDIALFTNLSQDHLDFHGDMERYYRAKASLFTPERSRAAVVCIDDEWGRRLAHESTVPCVTVGRSGTDVRPDYMVVPGGGTGFELVGSDGLRLTLRSALPGDFNVTNTAMAAVTLLELGHRAEDVAAAMGRDPRVPGRMERVDGHDDNAPLAVVDYAHTPDAVAAVLAALRPETAGPLVVVLGAGGERDVGKRAAMGRAAAAADVVIVTDDNPRGEDAAGIRGAIVAGARSAGSGATVEEVAGRREAIARAVRIAVAAGPSATVAVVGKGHESGQEIAGVVHPFDDRDELALALSDALKEDG